MIQFYNVQGTRLPTRYINVAQTLGILEKSPYFISLKNFSVTSLSHVNIEILWKKTENSIISNFHDFDPGMMLNIDIPPKVCNSEYQQQF